MTILRQKFLFKEKSPGNSFDLSQVHIGGGMGLSISQSGKSSEAAFLDNGSGFIY